MLLFLQPVATAGVCRCLIDAIPEKPDGGLATTETVTAESPWLDEVPVLFVHPAPAVVSIALATE